MLFSRSGRFAPDLLITAGLEVLEKGILPACQ
jgi:hypothetical protein